jgi:hypothetical protein
MDYFLINKFSVLNSAHRLRGFKMVKIFKVCFGINWIQDDIFCTALWINFTNGTEFTAQFLLVFIYLLVFCSTGIEPKALHMLG